MATVAVTIAGRVYRMACGEGEEAHLQAMALHVDKTLAALRQGFGEIGDQRLVIMTAITVADELSEAKKRIAALEAEIGSLRTTTSQGEALRDALAAEVAVSLNEAAVRIEQIAQELNGAGREG
jgi:cell division protein ZapA